VDVILNRCDLWHGSKMMQMMNSMVCANDINEVLYERKVDVTNSCSRPVSCAYGRSAHRGELLFSILSMSSTGSGSSSSSLGFLQKEIIVGVLCQA
jgi:hypothetical protein